MTLIPKPFYSDALTRALARHERWVNANLGEAHVHTSRALFERLQAPTPGARRTPLLRMAKARLRRTSDGPT